MQDELRYLQEAKGTQSADVKETETSKNVCAPLLATPGDLPRMLTWLLVQRNATRHCWSYFEKDMVNRKGCFGYRRAKTYLSDQQFVTGRPMVQRVHERTALAQHQRSS